MRFVLGQKIINFTRGKTTFKDLFFYIYFLILYLKNKCKEKNFDEIVSLGYNCENSQRINNIFPNGFNHYLYTYSYELDRKLFLKSLDELCNIYKSNFILIKENGMFLADEYQIKFHSKNKNDLICKNGEINNKNYEIALNELKSRLKYLGEKTENLFKSDKKTLFVMKLKYTNFEDDKDFIKNTFEIINRKYISGKFRLIIVLEKKDFTPYIDELLKISGEKLYIEFINNFAPDTETLTGGDIKGWIKVLNKNIYKN